MIGLSVSFLTPFAFDAIQVNGSRPLISQAKEDQAPYIRCAQLQRRPSPDASIAGLSLFRIVQLKAPLADHERPPALKGGERSASGLNSKGPKGENLGLVLRVRLWWRREGNSRSTLRFVGKLT